MDKSLDAFSLKIALGHVCDVYDTNLEEISQKTGYSLDLIEAMSLEGSYSDKTYRIEVMEFLKKVSETYGISMNALWPIGTVKLHSLSPEIGRLILQISQRLNDDEEEGL